MNGKKYLRQKAAQPRTVLTPQESETYLQTVWRPMMANYAANQRRGVKMLGKAKEHYGEVSP